MRLMSCTQRAERGDTLVEVLLAIAIISTILSGAYIVSNKSLLASRKAQEQGNALKLAQGQVERLKTVATTNSTSLFGGSTPTSFCIDDSNAVVDAPTNASCRVDADGTPVPASSQPAYQMATSKSGNIFTVSVSWASMQQAQPNKVRLTYKVFP